jgi:hypothetical protein
MERTPLVKQLPKVLGRSALGTVNLLVAGSAALGAAALHSWPIFALGAVAYTTLLAWDVASPKFWRETLSGNAEGGSKLPAADSLEDPRMRDAVRAIRDAHQHLRRALEGATPGVQQHMGLVLLSLTELEERAARLVARGEDLARYMRSVDLGAVREQLRSAQEQAHLARDAEARTQFESARLAREEQLAALVDIDTARERVLANLSRIAATMEGLPAKVVRLRALDDQATESMYGDLNEELGRMNGEIGAFEETLRSLHEVRVTP